MIRRIFFLAAIGAAFVLGACTEESPFHEGTVDTVDEVPDAGEDVIDEIPDDANNRVNGEVAFCGIHPQAKLDDLGVQCEPCSQDTECINDAMGVEFACDGAMTPATCRDPEEMEELDPCEDYERLNNTLLCGEYVPMWGETEPADHKWFETLCTTLNEHDTCSMDCVDLFNAIPLSELEFAEDGSYFEREVYEGQAILRCNTP